jgi:hypothetical protein
MVYPHPPVGCWEEEYFIPLHFLLKELEFLGCHQRLEEWAKQSVDPNYKFKFISEKSMSKKIFPFGFANVTRSRRFYSFELFGTCLSIIFQKAYPFSNALGIPF